MYPNFILKSKINALLNIVKQRINYVFTFIASTLKNKTQKYKTN